MAAQDFFVLHGEKLALGVAGLVCGWVIVGAFTDEAIRPTAKDATAADIKDKIAKIDAYRAEVKPPILANVPDYAARMRQDFRTQVPSQPLVAALMQHPNRVLGGGGGGPGFVVAFELLAPAVEVADRLGSLQVALTMPEAGRPNDRLAAGVRAEWKRSGSGNAEILNSAEVLGALVEMRVGRDPQAEWKPLNEGRPIPLAQFGQAITVPDVVDFEQYAFRARLVARATKDVAVGDGRMVPVEAPQPDGKWWERLTDAFKAGKVGDEFRLLRPDEALRALFPGVADSLYRGSASTDAVVEAQSLLRFQLDKLVPNPKDPAESDAQFLLTKLIRRDGKEGWLAHQRVVVPLRGMIQPAKPPRVPPPWGGRMEEWVLETPFRLEKIERGVERLLYTEVRTQARTDGKPGKRLELRDKKITTDVATVVNTRNGQQLKLLKLGRLTRPADPKAVIFPDLKAVDEEAEFARDPAAFVQAPLEPGKPIEHQPDQGPLERMRLDGDKLAKTDTPYYELPDGRLVYYEPINKETIVVWLPGRKPKEEPVPPPEETPPVEPVAEGAEGAAEGAPPEPPVEELPPEPEVPTDESRPRRPR